MTVVIDEDRTSQFLIKKSNETFRFLADNNFVVDSANGILERKGENRNKIDVQNYIEVQGEGFAAIHATGLKTKVSTGVGAVFSADMGILHQGDQGRVFFFGSMEAVTAGIRTTGRGASVVSDGSLGSDGMAGRRN